MSLLDQLYFYLDLTWRMAVGILSLLSNKLELVLLLIMIYGLGYLLYKFIKLMREK